MNGRLAGIVLAALVVAASPGWQQSGAAPDEHRHTKEETARHHEKLQLVPTADAQQLGEQAQKARAKAAGNGYYACCIEPACSWCLLHIGKCTCVLGVGTGKWACRECHGGWEAGQGRIPGKSREDVRKMKTLMVEERREARNTAEATDAGVPTASASSKPVGAGAQTVAAGKKLYRKLNCQSCHTLGNAGGGVGPDLTHEAQRHSDIIWQVHHLQHPDQVHPGSSMPSFANLKLSDLETLAAYLVAQK